MAKGCQYETTHPDPSSWFQNRSSAFQIISKKGTATLDRAQFDLELERFFRNGNLVRRVLKTQEHILTPKNHANPKGYRNINKSKNHLLIVISNVCIFCR
jgi:hypothetical protein